MSRKNRERAWSRFHAVPKEPKEEKRALQLTNAYTEKYARELSRNVAVPRMCPDGLIRWWYVEKTQFMELNY